MPERKHKTLIIKLGYSETLFPESTNPERQVQMARTKCSLGDVFRTTAVLHLLKNDHITWLTDADAVPLLEGNPHIARILPFDLLSVLQLESERFDKVINLEKGPGICALVNRINAWSHYGFRFDAENGSAEAYDRAYEALAVATRDDVKKLNDKPWVSILFEMMGAEWKGESYILGYKPTTPVVCDVGFNSHVGSLMPTKAWPAEHWDALQQMLSGTHTVCRQQFLDNLHGYMDWINSCRILITNDSLGLHLGIALGKKVIALLGPSASTELSPHPNLRILTPSLDRDCIPCCKAECEYGDPCMRHITPQAVCDAIQALTRN